MFFFSLRMNSLLIFTGCLITYKVKITITVINSITTFTNTRTRSKFRNRIATFKDSVEDRFLLAEQGRIQVSRRNGEGSVIRSFACRTMRAREDAIAKLTV